MVPIFLAVLMVQAHAESVLMEEIERGLDLPQGAKPLAYYSRHYAYDGPSRVTAIYLLPFPEADPRACQRLQGSALVPCSEAQISAMVASQEKGRKARGEPGTRRWHKDRRDMPFIYDGGCMQVNVTYDLGTRHATVACNGIA